MFQVYPADARFSVDLGWLRSRPSFSFGEYQDPNNMSFGVMRICNDDYVAPGRGFGPHPHSDMEIVTIVLSGGIKHEDNLGNSEVTSAGQIQRMTAGSGIIHAENNASSTEELTLLQLWFMPSERGLPPSYETRGFEPEQMKNTLLPVVTSKPSETAAYIHQDMTIYLSLLQPGKQLSYHQEEGRRIFLFVMEGSLSVNDTPLGTRDSARLENIQELSITADASAYFMLIDLP